jgi:hypothetical protein
MLKKPLHIAHGEIRDASGVRVPATEVDGLLRQVNAFDALLAACEDLLCFTSPGGIHGTEPESWSDEAKRICGAARAAIAAAKPEPAKEQA